MWYDYSTPSGVLFSLEEIVALVKPLTPEEVSEEYRGRVDFENQFQQSYSYAGRTKMRAMVFIKCPVCGEDNSVPTNDVRNFIRGVRRQFPGTHRSCKYPGIHQRGDGYVMKYCPDHPNAVGSGYVMEHILVMESALGRHLNRQVESVHHINGDNSDNRLENLQLRFKYHGKGQAWGCNDCGSNNVRPVALKDTTVL